MTNKATTQKISQDVRSWYEASRKFIPSLESSAFATIAGSHNKIAENVTFGLNRKCTHGVDMHSPTAYFDAKNRRIMIPATYLNRNAILSFVKDPEADVEAIALALVNGSQIHEALHFFHTPDDWTSIFPPFHNEAHKAIVAQIANVVEDLFIETVASYNPLAETFLNAKNAILFQSETIETISRYEAENDLEAFLTLLVNYKNPALRELIALKHPGLVRILEAFLSPVRYNASTYQRHSAKDGYKVRTQTIDQIYRLALPLIGVHDREEEKKAKERAEKASSSPSIPTPGSDNAETSDDDNELDNEPETGDESEEAGDEDESTEENDGEGEGEGEDESESEDESEGEDEKSGEGYGSEGDEESENAPESLSELASKIEAMNALPSLSEEEENSAEVKQMAIDFEMASKVTKENATYGKQGFPGLPKLIVTEITNTGFPQNAYFKPAEGDYKFVSVVRQLRVKNHTHGEALKTGSVLVNTRISRIATDGKIFGRRETPVDANKIPEFVILVDASGSMGGNYAKVLAQAWSLFTELKKIGIPTSVYAHTSMKSEVMSDTPVLYHIASYNMRTTTTDATARFQTAFSISQSQNYDGFVIDWLNNNAFTPRMGAKLLMVLSDGIPSGEHEYAGSRSIQQTMEAITNARKIGRIVIAFSLVQNVVERNSQIYGKTMNINASLSFEIEFKKLFERMQQEGRL